MITLLVIGYIALGCGVCLLGVLHIRLHERVDELERAMDKGE